MALFRNTIKGTFPGEIWSFGLHTEGNVTVTVANQAMVTALDAFYSTAVAATMCADVIANAVSTAELVQTTGKQLDRVETVVLHPGTNAGACLPFQCALVVTTRGALQNSEGHGRFYVPSLAVDQQDGGTVIPAAQNAILAGAAAMLGALETAGLQPVLYGAKSRNPQPIVRVEVGNVVDTQRRRRNKLPETRVSANV